jgi:peptidyl-prolyl cis-trans isomerase B (cyclophilin B)
MKPFITIMASLGLLLITDTAISGSLKPVFIIETSEGVIKVELNDGPSVTTRNFEHYAQEGFYNGTIFHRVIKGFMIQGGGFSADMKEKAPDASPIKNEGDLCGKNTRGTLAMARTSDPHSATAQFFINTVDNSFLDFTAKTSQGWGYCSFGHVIEGMEVVDKIESMPTKTTWPYQDVPATLVIINDVTLIEPAK